MRSPTPTLRLVRRLVRAGQTWTSAAAAAGIAVSTAWEQATGLWPELKGRLPRVDRQQVEQTLLESNASYRAIARRIGCSPDTVSRIARDLREAECSEIGGPRFRMVRPYSCAGCGQVVTYRPCVLCAARKAKGNQP